MLGIDATGENSSLALMYRRNDHFTTVWIVEPSGIGIRLIGKIEINTGTPCVPELKMGRGRLYEKI